MREALAGLMESGTLPEGLAEAAVGSMLDGEALDAEIAAFLTLAQARGVTPPLLRGATRAVRARMTPLDVPDRLRPVLDTCGTGGDGARTLNVSTAAAIVAASCGARVAKHGNRAATGRSGSSDVLAALGVSVEAAPEILIRCLEEAGIAYLHAPAFHPALKRVGPIRERLPFPTLFNLIGPLANPARPEAQLIGAPDAARCDLLSETLTGLERSWPARAVLVHADDGLDEVSLGAATWTRWLDERGHAVERWIEPEEFRLGLVESAALRVEGPEESARRIRAIFAGEPDPGREVVIANAALGLMAARVEDELEAAVARAREAILGGRASRTLETWARLSRSGA